MNETPFRKLAMQQLKGLPNSKWTRVEQRQIRGTPDCFGCIHGHLILIEFKASGKKATAQQQYEIARWEDAGAVCYVATPENWDDIFHAVKRLAENGIY